MLAQTFLRGRQWRRRTEVRRRAFGDKGCVSRLPRILYHEAKDVCLHRHFCEAVNGAGARKCAEEPSATKTASAGFCSYYTTKQKMCASTDIFARPSIAQAHDSA